VERELVQKSGAWYSMGGVRIGQGKENARQWMLEHPDEAAELRRKIMEASGVFAGSSKITEQPTKNDK
jgi:recombination protein RecA